MQILIPMVPAARPLLHLHVSLLVFDSQSFECIIVLLILSLQIKKSTTFLGEAVAITFLSGKDHRSDSSCVWRLLFCF